MGQADKMEETKLNDSISTKDIDDNKL